jgi:hypothetical protein
MEVTVERVTTFNLRNLLGHDCSPEVFAVHADCLTSSTVIWLGRADGVEACAVGVIPLGIFSEKAYLWMIHTKICEQHPLRFIRWSRRVLDEVFILYPRLVGLCDVDNLSGQRWLRWLGVRFDNGSVRRGIDYYRFEVIG